MWMECYSISYKLQHIMCRVLQGGEGGSPASLLHSRIWSPLSLVESDSKRIWSPAVSCEKENSSNTSNNNNNNSGKVVVEVRCGGCGDVTSQFRPDTSARCSRPDPLGVRLHEAQRGPD